MRRDDLFKRIDPPRDGLARLRARLDAEEGRWLHRRRYIGLAVGVVGAACVAGLAVSPLGPYRLTLLAEATSTPAVAPDLRSIEHPALVALGIEPPSNSAVSVVGELAREVPVGSDEVIYFVVASRGGAERPAATIWESGGSRSTWRSQH